ncbi:hypothetical protein KBB05_04450 [Patescibacteria group bacterium]|nr:hypothetical protein [Patescibacteria group bacterium]
MIRSPARSPFSYLSSYSSASRVMSDTSTLLSDKRVNLPDFARLFISANLPHNFFPTILALGTQVTVI